MNDTHSLPLVHWGLDRWPFCQEPRTDQLYPTASFSEALARLDYVVETRRRMAALLGEQGAGKSLLLKAAARQLSRQGRAVLLLDATGITTRELVWRLACGLGAAPGDDADGARLWRQVADRVVENRLQQKHTVLLVDEAGMAGPDVMLQLARLARLDPSPAARWSIVLAAEPEQAAYWNAAFRNLVDLRIDLLAWSEEDTTGYVQMALVEAGRLEPVFEDEALQVLHQLTRGVPRQVVRLADFAMLAGAGAGVTTIDSALVEAAQEEIAWPSVEAAAY